MAAAMSSTVRRAARNVDAGGFDAAQAQAVIAQAHFHRIAQRREADHFDLLAFEQTHFHEALDKAVLPVRRRCGRAGRGAVGRGKAWFSTPRAGPGFA